MPLHAFPRAQFSATTSSDSVPILDAGDAGTVLMVLAYHWKRVVKTALPHEYIVDIRPGLVTFSLTSQEVEGISKDVKAALCAAKCHNGSVLILHEARPSTSHNGEDDYII